MIRFECAFGHGAIRGAGLTVGQAWSLVCWWLSAASSLRRLWQCRKELAHAGTRVFLPAQRQNTHQGLTYSLLRQLALHHDTYKLHVAERRCWMRLPFTARMLFLHEGHCTIASFGLLALRMVVKNSIGCVSTGGPAARAS